MNIFCSMDKPAPSSAPSSSFALAMAASCSCFGLPLTIRPSSPTSACSRPFVLPNLPRRYLTTFSTALSLRSVVYNAFEPVEAVVNPALSQANVLFFTSGYNVQIVVEENESEEMLIRRFRREVSKAGIIPECKRRMFFENIQEEKKRKFREAGRRNRRRRMGQRFSSTSQEESTTSKKASDDMDDNWELPEGGIPS